VAPSDWQGLFRIDYQQKAWCVVSRQWRFVEGFTIIG
jgi:hypothetical protein